MINADINIDSNADRNRDTVIKYSKKLKYRYNSQYWHIFYQLLGATCPKYMRLCYVKLL